MKTIFAYSLSRVSNKEEAEDLCSDIITAILASAPRIRDEDAFFGYIWAIAANTYKKYLRKRNRAVWVELDEETPKDDDFVEQILKREELKKLKRELALLSCEYRKCTVAYYIDNLSCSETATKLGISLEMVKYYLFKTRKLLKEGIGMEREYGEKSYKPAEFEFVTIFSGKGNNEYTNLFNRKLPGNILLSAYYTPMTIGVLSIELGVSSAYMEDETDLLVKYGLLSELPAKKYQTNLVIFTSDYMREFYSSVKEFCTAEIGNILREVRDILPRLRNIGFRGNTIDDNRLMWPMLWLVMHRGDNLFESNIMRNRSDKIYNGELGVNYGTDYNEIGYDNSKVNILDSEYESYSFAGCAPIDDIYAASYADFGVLAQSCQYANHENIVKTALYSSENTYAIFNKKELSQVEKILTRQIDEVVALYAHLTHSAIEPMKVYAPKNLDDIIEKVVTKTIFFRTVGLIGKCALDSGQLILPAEEKPVAVFVYETK